VTYFVEKLDDGQVVEGTSSSLLGLIAALDRLRFMSLVLLPLKLLRTPDQVAVDARISPSVLGSER
jgi:hypothetical protein